MNITVPDTDMALALLIIVLCAGGLACVVAVAGREVALLIGEWLDRRGAAAEVAYRRALYRSARHQSAAPLVNGWRSSLRKPYSN